MREHTVPHPHPAEARMPAAVFSLLGPVAVSVEEATATDAELTLGTFDRVKRRIRLDAALAPAARLATLWHECTHVALWDAGADNSLTERQAEIVCDALGTYLAAATLAGYLTLNERVI
jgi:hypothetical protein